MVQRFTGRCRVGLATTEFDADALAFAASAVGGPIRDGIVAAAAARLPAVVVTASLWGPVTARCSNPLAWDPLADSQIRTMYTQIVTAERTSRHEMRGP